GHCRGGLRTGLGRLRGGRLGGSVGVDPEVPAPGGRAPGRIQLPPRGRRPGQGVDGPARWRVEAIRHLVAPSEARSSGPGFPPRMPTSSRPVSSRTAVIARGRDPCQPPSPVRAPSSKESTMSDSTPQPRSVLITGGNRGIGRSIAEEFLRRGDQVAVTSRSGEGGPEGALTVAADVTDGE